MSAAAAASESENEEGRAETEGGSVAASVGFGWALLASSLGSADVGSNFFPGARHVDDMRGSRTTRGVATSNSCDTRQPPRPSRIREDLTVFFLTSSYCIKRTAKLYINKGLKN